MNRFFKTDLVSWFVMLSTDYCLSLNQERIWMEAYLRFQSLNQVTTTSQHEHKQK